MEQTLQTTLTQENCRKGIEMFQGYPDVLNLDEMSKLLQISTKTGRRLLNSGEIHSFRIGRNYRIPKSCLISYVTGIPLERVC